MNKLIELKNYIQFELYTANDEFVLQLFFDCEPNDIDATCCWENSNTNLEKLIDKAIDWCKENNINR